VSEHREGRRSVLSADAWTQIGLLLLLYLAARWGVEVAGLRGAFSPIWPASGIGLVLVLRYGYRVWPLILGVSAAAAWPETARILDSFASALGPTALIGIAAALKTVLVAWGIRRLAGDAYLDQAKPFLVATLVAVPLGAAAGTFPSVVGRLLGDLLVGVLADGQWLTLMLTWNGMAIANIMGMVVLAPPMLLWLRDPHIEIDGRRILELLLYAALVAMAFVIREAFHAVYLLVAIHIVIAIRMPTKWAALAVLLTSVLMLWRTGTTSVDIHNLRYYDFFFAELSSVLVLNLTTYAVAFLWQEKEASEASLQSRVVERTQELEKANNRLRVLARQDPLTGVSNRRYFEHRGIRELERAARTNTTVALLVLDIDRFKRINDEHGHAVGDMVLKETVTRLESELRPTDVFARIGGEEFVVLLPECDEAYAVEVAERLRAAVARMPVTTQTGFPVAVTISIGVTVDHSSEKNSSACAERLQAMMHAADRNLYQAKELGRNRVVGPPLYA